MKIKSITKIHLAEPIPVYDVVNVPENHNFLIKGHYNKDSHICLVSHNCLIDEMSFRRWR